MILVENGTTMENWTRSHDYECGGVRLAALDLFSGIGGFGLGLQWAGGRHRVKLS